MLGHVSKAGRQHSAGLVGFVSGRQQPQMLGRCSRPWLKRLLVYRLKIEGGSQIRNWGLELKRCWIDDDSGNRLIVLHLTQSVAILRIPLKRLRMRFALVYKLAVRQVVQSRCAMISTAATGVTSRGCGRLKTRRCAVRNLSLSLRGVEDRLETKEAAAKEFDVPCNTLDTIWFREAG